MGCRKIGFLEVDGTEKLAEELYKESGVDVNGFTGRFSVSKKTALMMQQNALSSGCGPVCTGSGCDRFIR